MKEGRIVLLKGYRTIGNGRERYVTNLVRVRVSFLCRSCLKFSLIIDTHPLIFTSPCWQLVRVLNDSYCKIFYHIVML